MGQKKTAQITERSLNSCQARNSIQSHGLSTRQSQSNTVPRNNSNCRTLTTRYLSSRSLTIQSSNPMARGAYPPHHPPISTSRRPASRKSASTIWRCTSTCKRSDRRSKRANPGRLCRPRIRRAMCATRHVTSKTQQ